MHEILFGSLVLFQILIPCLDFPEVFSVASGKIQHPTLYSVSKHPSQSERMGIIANYLQECNPVLPFSSFSIHDDVSSCVARVSEAID